MTGRVAWVRAIAIRAGLSVHIVDVCSGQLTNEPVQCEADGLSVIKIKDHGQHFKVTKDLLLCGCSKPF